MTTKPKPKMGRPSKGKDARRIPVVLRITERESTEWSKHAKAAGQPLGVWLAQPRRDEMEKE